MTVLLIKIYSSKPILLNLFNIHKFVDHEKQPREFMLTCRRHIIDKDSPPSKSSLLKKKNIFDNAHNEGDLLRMVMGTAKFTFVRK